MTRKRDQARKDVEKVRVTERKDRVGNVLKSEGSELKRWNFEKLMDEENESEEDG